MPGWYVICLIAACATFAIDAWLRKSLQSVGLFLLSLAQVLYGK
jgi:hypothetical protein